MGKPIEPMSVERLPIKTTYMNNSQLKQWFSERYIPEPNSGCWIWLLAVRKSHKLEYGAISFLGKSMTAHRAAWIIFRGPVEPGIVVDHLCRNTLCVNPAHLEPTTNKINCLRGESIWATNARKTHCINGHAFDDVNTYEWRGKRLCRACGTDRHRAKQIAIDVEA